MNNLKKQLLEELVDLGDIEVVAITAIIAQYKHRCANDPKWPVDHIHGAAIVANEAGELINSVFDPEDTDTIVNEAGGVSAVALRFLVNMLESLDYATRI